MADKTPDFPVVLEKDGQKRTAHSVIAYNQLKTQGYAEGSKPAAKRSSKSKSAAKADDTNAK